MSWITYEFQLIFHCINESHLNWSLWILWMNLKSQRQKKIGSLLRFLRSLALEALILFEKSIEISLKWPLSTHCVCVCIACSLLMAKSISHSNQLRTRLCYWISIFLHISDMLSYQVQSWTNVLSSVKQKKKKKSHPNIWS